MHRALNGLCQRLDARLAERHDPDTRLDVPRLRQRVERTGNADSARLQLASGDAVASVTSRPNLLRVRWPLRAARQDGDPGGASRERVPVADTVGDAQEGGLRLGDHDRYALAALGHGDESRRARLVGEPVEDRLRDLPQLRLEAGGQRDDARAEPDEALGRAHDETVHFQRRDEAVGDGAVNTQGLRQLDDRQARRPARHESKRLQAAVERLKWAGRIRLGRGSRPAGGRLGVIRFRF